VTNDVGQDRIVPVTASTRIHAWTLAGLFQAGLFYINRLLQKPNILYSSLAAALISGVLAQELPQRFIGTGWLAFASILFALGLRRMLSEFRFQAYVLAAAGVVITVALDVLTTSLHPWLSPTCALILVYALISHLRFSKAELPHIEHKWLEIAGAAAITTLALLVVWHLAPKNYRGLSSCVLALVLFELGALKLPAVLVRFSYLAMALASLIVIGEQSTHFIRSAPNYVWISYAGAALCLSFLSERAARGEVAIQIAASSAAVVFTLCALWILLPGVAVAPAWSAIAVTLFVLGLRRDLVHERWQGYLVMVASLLNAWDANLHLPAALVVFACYLAQFLSPAQGRHLSKGWLGFVEEYPRVFWSLLGTVLLTALLWRQFPGGLLTTAWGVEGLTLLGAGFPLRERALRLEGLSMLLLCILKLFLYDLRNLETVYRILSFVALGLILLGVSWIYTRFRERVSRYL
jgi:hypothetical protein